MDNIIGESTGLYFYSTVFQGNMALLALVGVFAIYKLQQNYNSLEEIKQPIIKLLNAYSHNLHILYYDIDNLLETISTIAANQFDNNNPYTTDQSKWETIKIINDTNNNFQNLKALHIKLSKTRASIIKEMKSPFIWTLIIIIGSLVLLPFATVIHKLLNIYEITPMLWIIGFNVIALVKNKKYIFDLLKI